MRVLWVAAVALCFVSATVCAQITQEPDEFLAERARIEAARVKTGWMLDEQELACQARFAVTDCVNGARARRRQLMSDLDRQSAKLNDAQRFRQASERQKARQEKLEERLQRNAAQSGSKESTDAPAVSKERVPGAASKANQTMVVPRSTAPAVALDPAALEAKKTQYRQKQMDAEQRRALRDQRLREPAPAYLSLPVPP